ncbi:MAG: dienelactone hydrolase [Acidobacteria bacterium]|nr:MAG: dienelactone hydrolase [Acidobacteriota bacterium]
MADAEPVLGEPPEALDAWDMSVFEHEGKSRRLFVSGEGRPVILISEIPGMTPEQIALGDRLIEAGFKVIMPEVFGESGAEMTNAKVVARLSWAGISSDWATFSLRTTSPIASWMRALARDVSEQAGGAGVGAIGMCISGNLPLAMLTEESVVAPVLSQPSLPFNFSKTRARDLGISDEDCEAVKKRMASGAKVLAFRFSHDFVCPGLRFERMRAEFGDAFTGVELDSSPGNAHGFGRSSHSVLAHEFVDDDGHPAKEAFNQTVAFLRERLG